MTKNDEQAAEPGDGAKRRPGQEPRLELPKRFYKVAEAVAAGHHYQIHLDGRPLKTPKKRTLEVPNAALADAVAEEWRRQVVHINPAVMPLTRIANTAIDAVADAEVSVAADVAAYAGSDLLCYRADGPGRLVERQAAAWDPVLSWAQATLGARFVLSEGVMPVQQSAQALEKIAAAVAPLNKFQLSALHVLTTLTGSALLAIAYAKSAMSLDAAWTAAHIDEDWEIEQWGPDEEAAVRRQQRRIEFDAAGLMLRLLR